MWGRGDTGEIHEFVRRVCDDAQVDWDDLRYALAIARARTLSGAAESLGVSHTTVGRRLRALEERLGARLFDATPDGFAATPAGDDLVAVAERVEADTLALEGRVLGRDERLTGALRVSAMELVFRACRAAFTSFAARYPSVALTVTATDDEVWAALELAGLREVFERRRITLTTPLWNTTDAATDLSGGQWQRLTLARAILAARRGKRVLILDEPTSQYDVRGETNFYNTVMAELAGVTVVLITHRLSTVRRADRIALLQDGRISEVGTHDELLEHGGAYAAMFRAQADRFREIA